MRDLHIRVEDDTFKALKEHYPDRGQISVLCRCLLELAIDCIEAGRDVDHRTIATAVITDDRKRGILR